MFGFTEIAAELEKYGFSLEDDGTGEGSYIIDQDGSRKWYKDITDVADVLDYLRERYDNEDQADEEETEDEEMEDEAEDAEDEEDPLPDSVRESWLASALSEHGLCLGRTQRGAYRVCTEEGEVLERFDTLTELRNYIVALPKA